MGIRTTLRFTNRRPGHCVRGRWTQLVAAFPLVCGLMVAIPGEVDAFGGDGNNPSNCPSPITARSKVVSDSTGYVVGVVQLRWDNDCYYGVAWSRTCVKAGYTAYTAWVYRIQAPAIVGTAAQGPQSYSQTTPVGSCPSPYVSWTFSKTVFDNCTAAGLGVCKAYAFGQVFLAGSYVNSAETADY